MMSSRRKLFAGVALRQLNGEVPGSAIPLRMASSACSAIVESPSSRCSVSLWPNQIVFRLGYEADAEFHAGFFFALARRDSSFFSMAADDT